MDATAYEEASKQALEGLESMLFGVENPMVQFKRASYPELFQSYYQKHEPVIAAMENVYQSGEDQQGWCQQLAVRLADLAEGPLKAIEKKSKREDQQLNFNMVLATYLFPAILEYRGRCSGPVTDAMVEVWNKRYKVNVGKATYEKIEEGFHRKFCYITTAVCESLGKEDDCYELELLRHYRDTYLMGTREGRALVEEYYDIAPTIVTRINRQENRAQVYQQIWNEYLKPCIRYIEGQNLQECESCYTDMVLELKGRYIA
ncbi:MAG: hypothetical protein HFI30_08430 [Lachnospiraceae bacterium]|jgi:hypothetical protein|nr:hypothetical protein [Lachnospiraceae bacterium]MCI8995698.1 hypothetical protein [Lachnospiraceae bacterium]